MSASNSINNFLNFDGTLSQLCVSLEQALFDKPMTTAKNAFKFWYSLQLQITIYIKCCTNYHTDSCKHTRTQYIPSFDVNWLRTHAILITSEKLLIVNQIECQMNENENETERLIRVSSHTRTASAVVMYACVTATATATSMVAEWSDILGHSVKMQRKHALFPSLPLTLLTSICQSCTSPQRAH